MVEILKEWFNRNPEKSKIVLNDRCWDCKSEIIIQITPTEQGFGLQGGALFKNPSGGYYAKCPVCYMVNPMTVDE